MRTLASLMLATLALASPSAAQEEVPSDVSFTLTRAYLQALMTGGPGGRTVGARLELSVQMGEHSNVHALGSDCELHVAARMTGNAVAADPPGIVVEPPNVCKSRLPQIPQTGSIGTAWSGFFTSRVSGHTCTVIGFPRIFSEHAAGGEAGGSNPDHVLELHPATSIRCGATNLDFLPLLRVHPGMRRITDNSAVACLSERRLFVRERGTGAAAVYEFREQGANGNGGRCGNFVVVDAHISKRFLRELSNQHDHLALARVWIGESGPFPLKVYTYSGTDADQVLAQLFANPDPSATVELPLHGLLTYDYFTIARVLQDKNREWRADIPTFEEIPSPLSLVVFGRAATP